MGPLPPLRKDTHRPASARDSFPQDCMLGLLRSHRSCGRLLSAARTSKVPEIRGPRTRSAAEAAKRSFAAEAAGGDLMVVEDGRREKVAEIWC